MYVFRRQTSKRFFRDYFTTHKDQKVKTIDEIRVDDYHFLVLPGGVKAMEKVRQEKNN